jgi:hypothetical protein
MSLSQSAIEYAGEYLCSSARLRFRCFYLSSGSSSIEAAVAAAVAAVEAVAAASAVIVFEYLLYDCYWH